MHTFNFTKTIHFTCADPDSAFVFEPALKKFHWYGKTLDKLGKYLLEEKNNRMFIELEYNFAREEVFSILSTEGVDDALTKFVLESRKTGKQHSFFRV